MVVKPRHEVSPINRSALVAAIATALALAASCVSTAVTVRPETVPTSAPAQTASYWEAVESFDFGRARQLAADRAQQDLAFAIETAHAGNFDDAVAAARRSWEATSDSRHKPHAREWLENILSSQSRWREILELYSQDPTPIDPTKDLRPFAAVYQAAPSEQYQFANAEDAIPVDINAFGMPVAVVEVNGLKKKFVIDTGATLTTVTTDVARESGMSIGREQARATTATTRTLVIRGAVIDHLRLGGLVVRNHPASVIESSALRARVLGLITIFNVDGVLGWNALRQMKVRIDYRDKTMFVGAPAKQTGAGPRNLFGITEPFVSLSDERGQRLLFQLDTGAARSSLHEPILTKIGSNAARRKKITLYGAGGSERYNAALIPSLTLYVSGHALAFKNLLTTPVREDFIVKRDGRLGSDIASKGSMTIDAANGRFELERKS